MDDLSILFPFFPTWRQIFIFALGLHSTTFSLGSRFLKGMLAFLESLSIVVFLHLHKVTCIFPRTFCWCFSRFVSLALSLIPYSYSWILVPSQVTLVLYCIVFYIYIYIYIYITTSLRYEGEYYFRVSYVTRFSFSFFPENFLYYFSSVECRHKIRVIKLSHPKDSVP